MTTVCSNCHENSLQQVEGILIFDNHISKECTAIFCKRCGNWESVPSLKPKTQKEIDNPYDEIKRCRDIIASHERDMAGMSGTADHQTTELQKTKEALAKCQNELRQSKQDRPLR